MRWLAILLQNIASSFENRVLPERNGGMLKKMPFGMRSWIMKPLSAKIRSPPFQMNRNEKKEQQEDEMI